jgi:hypothetical protein
MVYDEAAEIRRIVAERIDSEEAVSLLTDSDWLVRYIVAEKVPLTALHCLVDDPEPDVRSIVQQRLVSSPTSGCLP